MIDIVYPVGTGSVWNNLELKYSLRSIEKHLTGYRNIYIIGHKPDFITNVIHIPHTDNRKHVSDINIMHKINRACEQSDLSDQFLCVHDDHYILQDFEADKFPHYYSGSIEDYAKKRGSDSYGRRANNTAKHLAMYSKPTKNFDIHHPFLYEKDKFVNLIGQIDTHKQFGYMLKSLYANNFNIEGVEGKDSKASYPPTKDIPVFSTYPRISASVYRFLDYNFTEKCKFEA